MWMKGFICLTLLLFFGCAGKSFEYEKADSMKEGPGVFSKDPEGFTLYDSNADKSAEKSQTTSDAGTKATDAESAGGTAQKTATDPEEYREFQEFQQWKQEKAEFEEYRKWRESKEGADEYREFQEWKKWQEYKKWQERQ